jgi:enamine deaminase RidA (YjgF/YER057c/UK114 family)
LVAHQNGEGELMNKTLLALVCGLVLVVTGCGGNGNTAERKTACTNALAALSDFQKLGSKVGLDFRNLAKDRLVVATAATFRKRVEVLQELTTDKERQQLGGLTHGLVLVEKLFGALAVHDLPAAQKYDREAGTSLSATKLQDICKTSS